MIFLEKTIQDKVANVGTAGAEASLTVTVNEQVVESFEASTAV